MRLFALGDIHGLLEPLKKAMEYIDLSDEQNKLILLGDYIDGGKESCQVLYFIKKLQEEYPESVIVLRGNHEELFLEWLFDTDDLLWLSQDLQMKTTKSFLTDGQFIEIMSKASDGGYEKINKSVQDYIKCNHQELLNWLKSLPYFYETKKQIYVHAGIDEEAGEMWKYGTSEDIFVAKFPPQKGSFYKDIIAGHISTETVSKQQGYFDVYWDGANHYFLDGTVLKSGKLPILVYNTETEKYSSY